MATLGCRVHRGTLHRPSRLRSSTGLVLALLALLGALASLQAARSLGASAHAQSIRGTGGGAASTSPAYRGPDLGKDGSLDPLGGSRSGMPLPGGPGHAAVLTTTHWLNLYPGLYAASAVSSTEAWAGGDHGHMLHYTGGSWVDVDPPNMAGTFVDDIQMLSATEGWTAAVNRAYEYDGSVWNERMASFGNWLLSKVAPVSHGNVWGTAYDYTAGRYTLVHWDGGQWSTAGPELTGTVTLSDIAMASASDGWAVGYDWGGQTAAGVVLHYDGTSWSYAAPPPDAYELFAASANVPGELWVAGIGSGPDYMTTMYRYTGGS